VVPENIHTPTVEGHWKFQAGGELKAKIFKGMCVPKLEFPRGWGVGSSNPPKKSSVGGVWIFSQEQHNMAPQGRYRYPGAQRFLLRAFAEWPT